MRGNSSAPTLISDPSFAESISSTASSSSSSEPDAGPGAILRTSSSISTAGSNMARQFILWIFFHALTHSMGLCDTGGMSWTPPNSMRWTSRALSHSMAVVRRPVTAERWYSAADIPVRCLCGISFSSRLAAPFTSFATCFATASTPSLGTETCAIRARSWCVPSMNPVSGNRLTAPPGSSCRTAYLSFCPASRLIFLHAGASSTAIAGS